MTPKIAVSARGGTISWGVAVKKLRDSHITETPYWTHDAVAAGKAQGSPISKLFGWVNGAVLARLGLQLVRRRTPKRIEQTSFALGDTISLRNQALSAFLSTYFKKYDIAFDSTAAEAWIQEFDAVLKRSPISDLNGGMGYNNGLISYVLCRTLAPEAVIESGVWRGFTTYLLDAGTPKTARILCYDINFDLLEFKSSKATYFEKDVLENSDVDHSDFDFALFDDHVSHYDRLLFADANKVKNLIMDDDVSVLQAHADGWPPVPSTSMVFDYEAIPHQFEWVINGSNARADIRDLDVTSIVQNYIRIPYPELFDFTGYHNTSVTSLVQRREGADGA